MTAGRPLPRLRLLGAVLLIAGGAIHTWLAFAQYGTASLENIFFLNGAAAGAVAAAIVLTRGPVAPLAGAAISAGSLLAFALSRVGDGVVGFRATGLEPAPEALLTLLVEIAGLAVLGFVVVSQRQRLLGAAESALGRSG